MKNLIKFWQRDIINKIIVMLFLLLGVGVIGIAFVFMKMPAGRSIKGVVDEFFPTATLSPRVVMTKAAQKAMTQAAIATASVPPTITTMPFTPVPTMGPSTETPLPATSVFVVAATAPAAATKPAPTATKPAIPAPTAATSSPAATATPNATLVAAGAKCIPANTPQKGKVLDVIDGATVKVLIDGFAYVVRYIGVQTPDNKNFAMLASTTNGEMVFAKDVTLVPDKEDKDASGRLLRYVSVGDTFVNLTLIQKGLATVIDSTPNNACASVFADAQQNAKSTGTGMWITTPTP